MTGAAIPVAGGANSATKKGHIFLAQASSTPKTLPSTGQPTAYALLLKGPCLGMSAERGGRLEAILTALGDIFKPGRVSLLANPFDLSSVFKESTIFMANKAESSTFWPVVTTES
ncbi:MAG: hypothetical protein AAFP20_19060 [Cyanobacteria bacterium J06614_10]